MLSSVLFHSILERSAPLATSAIKRLRKSPMDLDVYAWLVHRLFHLSKPSMVSWEQLSNQFGHNYGLPRKFRHFFLDSLKRVSAVYPEAKLQISESGSARAAFSCCRPVRTSPIQNRQSAEIALRSLIRLARDSDIENRYVLELSGGAD
jgi:hypothetical protein